MSTKIYRTREAAEASAARDNAANLDRLNTDARRRWQEAVRDLKEYEALIVVGLRSRRNCPKDPGEFKPITEFGRWDERYRVVPIEFEDDRVQLTPQDPGEFLRERGRTRP